MFHFVILTFSAVLMVNSEKGLNDSCKASILRLCQGSWSREAASFPLQWSSSSRTRGTCASCLRSKGSGMWVEMLADNGAGLLLWTINRTTVSATGRCVGAMSTMPGTTASPWARTGSGQRWDHSQSSGQITPAGTFLVARKLVRDISFKLKVLSTQI